MMTDNSRYQSNMKEISNKRNHLLEEIWWNKPREHKVAKELDKQDRQA